MKYFGKLMLLTLALGLFAVVLSSIPSHPAAAAAGGPPPTTAIVTPNPLPITGSVNAAVTGTVGITGTPNVNVLSAPPVNVSFPSSIAVTGGPVNVANTPATPIFNRDVDNPASQPFVGSLCGGTVGECGSTSTSFAVPNTVGGR